eukprot:3449435-Prymnesium_polylepis.1
MYSQLGRFYLGQREVFDDQGRRYFWNEATNETRWEVNQEQDSAFTVPLRKIASCGASCINSETEDKARELRAIQATMQTMHKPIGRHRESAARSISIDSRTTRSDSAESQ